MWDALCSIDNIFLVGVIMPSILNWWKWIETNWCFIPFSIDTKNSISKRNCHFKQQTFLCSKAFEVVKNRKSSFPTQCICKDQKLKINLGSYLIKYSPQWIQCFHLISEYAKFTTNFCTARQLQKSLLQQTHGLATSFWLFNTCPWNLNQIKNFYLPIEMCNNGIHRRYYDFLRYK